MNQDLKKIARAEEMNAFYNSITTYNTSVMRKISENYYYMMPGSKHSVLSDIEWKNVKLINEIEGK